MQAMMFTSSEFVTASTGSRLVYSGVLQHLRAGPRARQRLNVERFLYLAQLRFVMVDDNDLPLFLGKPPCRMKANFSCADD